MKMKRSHLIVVALLLVGIGAGYMHGQQQPRGLHPCMQPYTPTKLEWIQLNVNDLAIVLSNDHMSLRVASIRPNTLHITVIYLPDADRAVLNRNAELLKGQIMRWAESLGVERHIRIKEEVEMKTQSEAQAELEKHLR